MALEDLTGADKFIANLNPANPVGSDDKRDGDNHIRGIKNVLKNTFPNLNGAMTASDEDLNTISGKVNRAGDTMTGQLNVLGHVLVGTTQVGSIGGSGRVAVLDGQPSVAWISRLNGAGVASLYSETTFTQLGVNQGYFSLAVAGQEMMRGAVERTATFGGTAAFFNGGLGCVNFHTDNIALALRSKAATAGTFWKFGINQFNSLRIVNNADIGVFLDSGSQSWGAYSDERLKTDFVEFIGAREKIDSLRAGTGRFKTDDPAVSRSMLIAQDVQAVLPEAVSEDEAGMLLLRYTELVPLLVAAVQELHRDLAELREMAGF